MPGKTKTKYGDEYESDDFETADTLIGRNRVSVSPVKKKTRPVSASAKKKSPRRPVTPAGKKKKKRPQSAPQYRSGHELWLNAVKQRLTVGLASNRRPHSPRHKTASEFWIDTLRKTNTGFTTESTGMNTFAGRRPRDTDMPYLSTPSYLRQKVGVEKPAKMADPTARPAPGKPVYKSQEEYYEQILEYKKQVSSMNQEASTMKAKLRRLEEDNLKKEKEIDSLLHPHKSEELRRTLADKRPDSGSMIHSLKQKILKLETQLRDKESAYIKLQSDLKTTKIEEMKQQMEVFYNEIVRLQNSKDTGLDKSNRPIGRDNAVKLKALNETVIRLNKANEQLQADNRALKEDLGKAMEGGTDRSPNSRSSISRKIYVIPGMKKDYEDMNRNQLLKAITQLEKKLEKTEKMFDGSSIISYESKAPKMQGKIALDGSLEDRLDLLDKRESELLAALEKKTEELKRMAAEKSRWKRRCEELEGGTTVRPRDYEDSHVRRPPSARRENTRPVSGRRESEAPSTPRSRPTSARRPESGKRRRSSIDSGISSVRKQKIQDFRENRSARKIQREWRSHNQNQRIQKEKVNKFRENHAAKTIQQQWTSHHHRKIEYEQDEASDLIRSALMGHSTRRHQMQHYQDDDDDYETDNEEYNECVNLIQSALTGHKSRKQHMRDYHFSSSGGDDDDTDIIESPARRFISSQRSNRPASPSIHSRSRPQSGKSRASISSLKGSGYGSSMRSNRDSLYGDGDDDF